MGISIDKPVSESLGIFPNLDVRKVDLEKYSPVGNFDKNLVKTYFEENLDNSFYRINEGYFLKIISKDKTSGFVFAGELQVDRNHAEILDKIIEFAPNSKLSLKRKFYDYDKGISGFSWEKSN